MYGASILSLTFFFPDFVATPKILLYLSPSWKWFQRWHILFFLKNFHFMILPHYPYSCVSPIFMSDQRCSNLWCCRFGLALRQLLYHHLHDGKFLIDLLMDGWKLLFEPWNLFYKIRFQLFDFTFQYFYFSSRHSYRSRLWYQFDRKWMHFS